MPEQSAALRRLRTAASHPRTTVSTVPWSWARAAAVLSLAGWAWTTTQKGPACAQAIRQRRREAWGLRDDRAALSCTVGGLRSIPTSGYGDPLRSTRQAGAYFRSLFPLHRTPRGSTAAKSTAGSQLLFYSSFQPATQVCGHRHTSAPAGRPSTMRRIRWTT